MPEITTLEQAQERIVELTEENAQLKTERDTLSKNNETLTSDLENQRTLTQKYFNKLIAQEETDNQNENGDDEGDDVPTCEEFAKTLNL